MASQVQNSSDTATLRRRQPLWPWLLMPLATLVIYFALHSARRTPPQTPAQATQSAEIPAAE